jgi:hypothetical protein
MKPQSMTLGEFALVDVGEFPVCGVVPSVSDPVDADLVVRGVGLGFGRRLLPPVGELVGLWVLGPGDDHDKPRWLAGELHLAGGLRGGALVRQSPIGS